MGISEYEKERQMLLERRANVERHMLDYENSHGRYHKIARQMTYITAGATISTIFSYFAIDKATIVPNTILLSALLSIRLIYGSKIDNIHELLEYCGKRIKRYDHLLSELQEKGTAVYTRDGRRTYMADLK